MVRVLFLTAPFKAHMIERMTDHFSSRITSEIFVPAYPSTKRNARGSELRISERFYGGRELLDRIKRLNPDVVYSDSPLYGAFHKASSIMLRKRRPMIIHLRGDWRSEFANGFARSSLRARAILVQHYLYSSAAIASAARLTPICRWLENIVKRHVPWSRTEVVYQGVDSQQFFPESGFNFESPSVAIIQNHTIYPKVVGLLNFRKVIRRLPHVNFYIAEGENVKQSLLPLIKQSFQSLANVHFLPGIDSLPAVRRMLTAADCYVLASGLDCCPTTVLEASLMSKPVLASQVGGVPEIVLEDETGWTAKNDDVETWISRLNRVFSEPRLGRRVGLRGRRWVETNFSWEMIARQVERLILQTADQE